MQSEHFDACPPHLSTRILFSQFLVYYSIDPSQASVSPTNNISNLIFKNLPQSIPTHHH